jgi:hypothetical protein
MSAIGKVDPSESSLIIFDFDQVHHRIYHQITFQIKGRTMGKNVFRTVINEGASTCIMSMSCWKDIGSP